MGYMRHHAIIVTAYQDDLIQAAHEAARSAIVRNSGAMPFSDLSPMLTPVIEAPVNGYKSFVLLPDGSKEGWEDSDAGDAIRDDFAQWLDDQAYSDGSTSFDWAEVQYGDDEGDCRVLRSDAKTTAAYRQAHPDWSGL